MVFNSCSDIPTLFMLLIMFASYAYRKVYTRLFLTYTFVLVYFIQLVLILKLINEIITRIQFLQQLMQANEDSTIVQINSIVFGGGSQKTDSDEPMMIVRRYGYFINLFICFYACQAWKSAKWMEIRYKTREH